MNGQLALTHVLERGTAPDTVLLLHGTGGDEHDLLPLGRALAPDANLLSPRGTVSESGLARWFRRHGEGVFDEVDLVERAEQLARFVEQAADGYDLDATRIVAAGFSNGANIAAALLLLHPRALRAAVLMAPMVVLRPRELPDLSPVACLLLAGRADRIAPPEQAEELAGILTDAGASVELRWHPGGHGVDRKALAGARAWLDRWRKAAAADIVP